MYIKTHTLSLSKFTQTICLYREQKESPTPILAISRTRFKQGGEDVTTRKKKIKKSLSLYI